MKLKTVTAACVLGCGLALTAAPPLAAADPYKGSAKDVPVPYVPLGFDGFYLGGNIGGAWGNISGPANDFVFPAPYVPVPFHFGDLSGSGVFGGIQGGYNFSSQGGPWVYGLEFDIGGMGAVTNSRNFIIPTPNPATFATLHTSGGGGWYGDITGRLGYSWGSTMLYAKGGFAWLSPNLGAAEVVTAGGFVITSDGNNNNNITLTGFTVGAGLEYLFSPNWSVKIEYLFFDFSNDNNGCCFDHVNNFRFFNKDLEVDTVKVGFNYYFHPAPVPLK